MKLFTRINQSVNQSVNAIKAISRMKKAACLIAFLFLPVLFWNFQQVNAQSNVQFLGFNTTTQGNWKGVYGGDGYNVINNATSYPSYAQVTTTGQVAWTWAASTTDVRALEKAATSDRIAATWFSNTNFNIDINFTDNAFHQVALYCLDWDGNSRTQTVEVRNATNNAVLDTRTLSNFNGGIYLVWNLRGHVILRVTRVMGDNALVSGLFFGPAANVPPTVSLTAPANGANFAALSNITLNATAADSDGTISKVEFFQGLIKLGEDLTAPYSLTWNSVAAGNYTLTARATDNGNATTTSNPVNISVGGSGTGPTVSFVSEDAITQGSWKSAYGGDGYNVINNAVSYPSYAQVTATGNSAWTWAATSTDVRALQKAAASDRIAATWYSASSLNININLTDSTPHLVALYSLDWDNNGRSQTVEVLNAATSQVLDTRTVSAFSAGRYLVWNLSGNVTLRVTRVTGTNAVVSGLFFGAAASTNTPPTVSITSPTEGATFNSSSSVTINATAADSDGTVSKVEFLVDGVKQGEDLAAPYSFTWNTVTVGNHALTARAIDNAGGTTTSAAVNITVQALINDAPTVSITAPANNASFPGPASITINANAADTDGNIAKVEFFQGGTKLGEDTTAPYSYVWNNVAAGSYVLLAKATDNGFATTTSSAVTVSVTSSVPTVTFVREDFDTQGSWKNVYGLDGYNVINDTANYPSYVQVTPAGNSAFTWAATTSDIRALQKSSGTERIAATWYTSSSFTVSLNFTDGLPHQLALYSLDWDSGGIRGQTVELLNAANNQVLDTRTVGAFSGGRYLVWNVGGSLLMRVTRTLGDNAVISGLFFGPTNANALPAVAMTSPANGASFPAPANLNLTAQASDSDGAINRVEFYAGTTLLGTDTAAPYTIVWNNVAAGSYTLTAKAYDVQNGTNTSTPVTITVTGGADPRPTVGEWSSVVTWPCIAIHQHVLPNGKVLLWQSDPTQEGTPGSSATYVWDIAANTFTQFNNTETNLFCSGHSLLADGKLLVTGGHIATDVGEPHTNIFDFNTNTWTRGADMNAGRWYPSNCALPNGETAILSGTIDTTTYNTLPQVYQTNGTLRSLTNAILELPFYPWMLVAPNGQVFVAGPDRTTRYLNTVGTGAWTTVGDYNFGFNREYGSGLMYEPGKVLIIGGGNPPTATAEVIDLNNASPSWRNVAAMTYARRNMNATLLPDGTVFVTGGSSSMNNDASGAVLVPELWNPTTETWTTMASMPTRRLYHSTALLLPDGRVVSAGGGFPSAQGDSDHPTAEFYSPPYLFKGARPTITTAPASVTYGQTFSVATPNAASISQVTLIKLSSVTHANNMGQRFNRLNFTVGTGALNVTAPANSNLCPPGHYLLFILNSTGVPSVAKIVRIN